MTNRATLSTDAPKSTRVEPQAEIDPISWWHSLRLGAWVPSLVAMLLVAFIWEMLSKLDPSWWPAIILSRPSDIAPAILDAVTTQQTWTEFWVTFKETIIGFGIAAVVGFLLGAAIGTSRLFRVATYPMLILFQSMPRVALIPVFIAWFGFGINSKIALAVTLAFFPIMINTIAGLTMVDSNAMLLMRSMRASRLQTFIKLRLPASLPTVMAGLKSGLTFALIGAIVAELSAANAGVGHLIETASFQLRMDDVFAYLLLLALMGLALFAVMAAVERKFVAWNSSQES